LGEVPVAFVELASGAEFDEAAIIEYCSARMASFKVPRAALPVVEWPMTESGKILKRELRDRLRVSGSGPRLVGQGG
jgi:acyl-CoA synthetase (AMP-forming)/AMP-acid ligase II